MFCGFSEETSRFLWDLKFNNERPWFLENKDRFDKYVGTPFKALAEDTYDILKERYPFLNTKLHVSRIYRDARRLYGKGPYKENLWFSIEDPRTANAEASLFFEITPSSYCYGMGFFCLKASQTELFRKRIEANPAEFENLALQITNSDIYSIAGKEYKKIHGSFSPCVNDWYNRRNPYAVAGGDFGGILYSSLLPQFLADRYDILMPMFEYLTDFSLRLNN